MLTEDSFFKNIPAALNLKQRIVWEAAGWGIEAISWSFEKLQAAAMQIDTSSAKFPGPIAREIFAHCWSIVAQCHMLRKMLQRTSPQVGGPTHIFLQKFESVTLIRNSMDHLHQQIENIAKAKDTRPPLFGALSFCRLAEQDIIRDDGGFQIQGCRIVTLTAGALTHKEHFLRTVTPWEN